MNYFLYKGEDQISIIILLLLLLLLLLFSLKNIWIRNIKQEKLKKKVKGKKDTSKKKRNLNYF